MSDNIKKTNQGKTINFAEKKKSINSKKLQSNPQKSAYNDNRVIEYDINKMREQINQQTKNKNKKSKVKNISSPLWVKAIYILASMLLLLLITAKLTHNFGFVKTNSIPSHFVNQSTLVSDQDFKKYNKTIKSYLNNYVKSKGELNIKTKSMHRNSNYIYANGYFTYPNEHKKISFDVVMTPEKVDSLMVNGYNLIENKGSLSTSVDE